MENVEAAMPDPVGASSGDRGSADAKSSGVGSWHAAEPVSASPTTGRPLRAADLGPTASPFLPAKGLGQPRGTEIS